MASPRLRRLGAFLRLEAYHTHGILRGLAQFAREHVGVEVLKLPQPSSYSPAAIRALRLDAIVARVTSARDEAALLRCGLPVVNVSGQFATKTLAWVNTDDARIGEMAATHLGSRGLRHFAYCGNRTHLASQRRRASFRAAAQKWADTYHDRTLARSHEALPFPGALRSELAQWIRTLPKPVGILGFNDRVVLELAQACQVAGVKIPHEVALVGVGNDLTRLEFAPTEITSIEVPTMQLGYCAAQTAMALLTGRRPPAEILLPPPKIVTRRSTDHFAVEDEQVSVALDYIREQRSNTIYVAEIARAAGLSRRVLERRFRAALGLSVYEHVQRMHLERAQELMADAALSLAEIAYASGYESQRHLNLAFRRLLDTTPGTVRKTVLQQSVVQSATS